MKIYQLLASCNATVSRRLQPSLFGPKIIKFRLNCFAHVQYLTLFWHANLYYRQHSLYGKYLASTHQSVKNSFVQCPIGLIWPMTKKRVGKIKAFLKGCSLCCGFLLTFAFNGEISIYAGMQRSLGRRIRTLRIGIKADSHSLQQSASMQR